MFLRNSDTQARDYTEQQPRRPHSELNTVVVKWPKKQQHRPTKRQNWAEKGTAVIRPTTLRVKSPFKFYGDWFLLRIFILCPLSSFPISISCIYHLPSFLPYSFPIPFICPSYRHFSPLSFFLLFLYPVRGINIFCLLIGPYELSPRVSGPSYLHF
jgi:hypothetical protein